MQYKEKLSYDPATGLFTWLVNSHKNRCGDVAGGKTEYGYVVINVHKKREMAHRVAWLLFYGWMPDKGTDIDHINRVKDDNRICNLRLATRKQNSWNCNKSKDNTSGFRGVSWHKKAGEWVARVHVERKCVFYKEFSSFDDACNAVEMKRKEIYSEFSGGNV